MALKRINDPALRDPRLRSILGMIDWNFQNLGPDQDPPNASDTVEDETSFDLSADAGESEDFSRADHTHGTPPTPVIPEPADTVTAETSFGLSSNAGASATYSRGDHTHGSPPAPMSWAPPAVGEYTTGIFGRPEYFETSAVILDDWIIIVPILLGHSATYDRIAARVGDWSMPYGDCRFVFGVYDSDSTGMPANKLANSTEVTPTSAGAELLQGTISLSLAPKLYFLAVSAKYGAQVEIAEPGSNYPYRLAFDTDNVYAWRWAYCYLGLGNYSSTLPSTLPTMTRGNTTSGFTPKLYLRRSA